MRTIVATFDNVLAYSAETWCTALNVHFSTSYTPFDFTKWPIAANLPDRHAAWLAEQNSGGRLSPTMAPDGLALDVLAAAHDAGYTINLVADRPPEQADATKAWFAQWNAAYDNLECVGPGGVPAALDDYGPGNPAIVISDDPDVCASSARAGLLVWQPARPWNRATTAGVWRFTDWRHVRQRLGLTAGG